MSGIPGDVLANLTAVGTCLHRWACAADQQEAEGFPQWNTHYRKCRTAV